MRTWVVERYQAYGRVCLITAAFLVPIVLYRGSIDPFAATKVTVVWILGLCALACWVSWSAERGMWLPRLSPTIPIAAFLTACTLATIFSQSPAQSLIGLPTRFGGLIPIALYVLVAVMMVAFYWEDPLDLKEILRAWAGAAVVVSIYVLIQRAGLDWMGWQEPTGGDPVNPPGTVGNSNFAGAFLGMSVPPLLYLALTAKRSRWTVLFIGLMGLDLVGLWITQTRGGMLAAAAGLAAMGFICRDLLARWVKRAAISTGFLLVIAAVLTIWHPGLERPPGPLSDMKIFSAETLEYRTRYWKAAWDIFLDNPLLGTGLDTYIDNYPRYRSAEDGQQYGFVMADEPHNIYLDYAASTGIPGLASYLVVVGLVIWFAIKRSRRNAHSERMLLSAFFGVAVGYLTQGAFSIDVPVLAVTGWAAFGGLVTIADPGAVGARERRVPVRVPTRTKKAKAKYKDLSYGTVMRDGPTLWPLHLITAVALLVLLGAGARYYLASVRMAIVQATEAEGEVPGEQVVDYYERKVLRLVPKDPTYVAYSGTLFEKLALVSQDPDVRKRYLEKAIMRHKQALHLRPNSVFFMLDMARVYEEWGQLVDPRKFTAADRWWRRIISIDGTNWEALRDYAEFLDIWADAVGGNPDLQRQRAGLLEQVTSLRPDVIGPWISLGDAYVSLNEKDKARLVLSEALARDPDNGDARRLLSTIGPGETPRAAAPQPG